MGRVPVRPDLLLSKRAEVQSEPSFSLGPAASSVALKRWLKEGTVRPRLCFLICLSRLPLQGGGTATRTAPFLPCLQEGRVAEGPVRPGHSQSDRPFPLALQKAEGVAASSVPLKRWLKEGTARPRLCLLYLSFTIAFAGGGGGPRPGLHLFCLAIKKAERPKAQSDQDSPSPTGHSPLLSRRQRGRSDRDQSQSDRPFPLALKGAEGSARP
jgi:hypothetical protein